VDARHKRGHEESPTGRPNSHGLRLRGATETGSASEDVLNSARTLSSESTRLRQELDRFMANIRAA
jgi:hypothetical protein